MSLRMRTYRLGFSQGNEPPDVVLFVRLADGETIDDLAREHDLIPSTAVKGDIVYLLDIRPGTYAAVAAFWGDQETLGIPLVPIGPVSVGPVAKGVHTLHRNYFSRELIAETRTRVEPGSFVFMGQFRTDEYGFDEPDELQAHFRRELEGEDYVASPEGAVAEREKVGRLSLLRVERDREALVLFCRQAQRHLDDSAWEPMVRRLRDGE